MTNITFTRISFTAAHEWAARAVLREQRSRGIRMHDAVYGVVEGLYWGICPIATLPQREADRRLREELGF